MNKCLQCGKRVILIDVGKHFHFCSKDCLEEYCEQYLQDNWREYAVMMGAHVYD